MGSIRAVRIVFVALVFQLVAPAFESPLSALPNPAYDHSVHKSKDYFDLSFLLCETEEFEKTNKGLAKPLCTVLFDFTSHVDALSNVHNGNAKKNNNLSKPSKNKLSLYCILVI